MKFLSQKYMPDVLESRIETLVDALKRIIRREAVEGILAVKGVVCDCSLPIRCVIRRILNHPYPTVLSLCWVTHGSNDDVYHGVARLLREVIKSGKAELRMSVSFDPRECSIFTATNIS